MAGGAVDLDEITTPEVLERAPTSSATVTVVLKRAKRPKPRNSTQIQNTSTVKNGHEFDPPSCSNISRRDCPMLSDSCTARLCIIRSASVLGERLRSWTAGR